MDDATLESLTREWMEALMFHKPVRSGVDGVLRVSGVVHLYGASGIHLYAVAGWIGFALKQLCRVLKIPSRAFSFLGLLFFLIAVLMIWRLQGFSFALFRPLSSILIRAGLRESGHRVWIFAPLILTFAIEWILSHETGLSPGASHYYLAVGGSLLVLGRGDSFRSKLELHFWMAIASWVPIALLDLYSDHLVAPWTPLISLLTIPPLTLLLFPSSLLALLFFGGVPEALFRVWMLCFGLLIRVLDLVPDVYSIDFDSMTSPALIAAPMIVLALKARHWFGLSGFSAIPLPGALIACLWAMGVPREVNQVVQFDVGQGDAALIREGSRAELVDAGPEQGAGPEVWIRRLSRFGVNRLDAVLFTHLDQDHVGGVHALASVIPIGCLEMSTHHSGIEKGVTLRAWASRLPEAPAIRTQGCIGLSRVGWFQSSRGQASGNRWMGGVFRRISDREAYFALGDGDSGQEEQFERKFRTSIQNAKVRVWKVGHHGSRFSSASGFLDHMNPTELWISVGRRNSYQHPSPETMARLTLQTGGVKRTDRDGDLIYRKGGSTL